MELTPARVIRVIASTSEEFAVVVKTASKVFLIFVGHAEAFTIYRDLKDSKPRRPLAHDLLMNIIGGFDIRVDQVVISSIVDNTFCATVFLSQEFRGSSEGERQVLRLDSRASDAMILAIKSECEFLVTSNVLDQVEDVTDLLDAAGDAFPS
ncbi:MAG: bifunctional nuclease domain-containing protein [Planctomycetota bacterium]